MRGGASNHGPWRKNVVNFHSTTIIYVVAIKSCKFWSRIIRSEIGITSFKSTAPCWESTCDDVTMVDECKQSTTMPSTHVNKNFQVNTFHDGLKAWMNLCRQCVCLESHEACIFNLQSEIWRSNRGIPVAIVTLSNLHNHPWVVLLQ